LNNSKLRKLFFLFPFLVPFSAHALLKSEIVTKRDQGPSRSVVKVLLLRGSLPSSFCTGTLIDKNVVLTAAHCFDQSLVPGLTGFKIVVESFLNGLTQTVQLTGIHWIQHPRFKPYGPKTLFLQYDIALAFFSGELPLDVSPSPLDKNIRANYSNRKVTVFGYGRSEDYTGIPGEDPWYSIGTLRSASLRIANGYLNRAEGYFVEPYKGSSLCQGDSGGPQFLVEGSNFKLLGVNSAGGLDVKIKNRIVTTCKTLGMAIKVAPFAKWIDQQIRIFEAK
jgi:hypothetical protein